MHIGHILRPKVRQYQHKSSQQSNIWLEVFAHARLKTYLAYREGGCCCERVDMDERARAHLYARACAPQGRHSRYPSG